MKIDKNQDWNHFWGEREKGLNFYRKLASFYNKQIIARALNYHINKHFKSDGMFLECGSGLSVTTARTNKRNRKFIALDFSEIVLKTTKNNPKIDHCINGDIFSLPFKDNSIDGIWNVGVMEHFSKEKINKILREFQRVLKRNGKVILLWPMAYAPYEIVFDLIGFIVKVFTGKNFQLYPDEVSKLKSKEEGKQFLRNNYFKNVKLFFNYRDAFSFGIVVGTKK